MIERIKNRAIKVERCLLVALGFLNLFLDAAVAFQPSTISPSSSTLAIITRQQKNLFVSSLEENLLDATDLEASDRLPSVDDVISDTSKAGVKCHFCNTPFASRNAVFRHLRSDGCTSDNPCSPGSGADTIVKQSIAILFGYVDNTRKESDDHDNVPMNDWAGQRVFEAVQETIHKYNNDSNDNGNQQLRLDFRLQESRTQSSVARQRSRILHQEPDCSAAGDVLIISGTCLDSSLPRIEEALLGLPGNLDTPQSNGRDISIRIWACKLLGADVSLHAEQSCTQLAYHYLVPLAWLPDGDLLKTQWKGWKDNPPTDSLRRFITALRSAESNMVAGDTGSQASTRQSKVAGGRFGRLGAKERRAWHNFAASIEGNSPNQEPIWRVVDSCRMTGMINFGEENASLIVEIKGDAFCQKQCRGIIGTALAIAHGWLDTSKQDLWNDVLLNPTCVVETVLAPPNRLYLANTRFHYEESRLSGKTLFESDTSGKVLIMGDGTTALGWVQHKILESREHNAIENAELEWLKQVRDLTAPRIRESLSQVARSPVDISQLNFAPTPLEYKGVLQKLRNIVTAGRWPETSVARSSVIGDIGKTSENGAGGSFTVINTKFFDKMNKNQELTNLPLGNQLFPDLANAVFALEEAIAQNARKAETGSDGRVKLSRDYTARRPQSTHCAINCNAQFTPHVDSGRGAGQSLSIIAGLGNYMQGELFVGKIFNQAVFFLHVFILCVLPC